MKYISLFFFFSFLLNIYAFNKHNSVIFFPAKFKESIPNDFYSEFASKLGENSDLHFAEKTLDENNILIKKIISDDKKVTLLSHLTSANDALNLYKNNDNIRNVILVNPINDNIFNIHKYPYFNPLNNLINIGDSFEKNIVDYKITIERKPEQLNKEIDDLLVITNKKNKFFNFIPSFNVIDYLNLNVKDLSVKKLKVENIESSHFDLLNSEISNYINTLTYRNSNIKENYHEKVIKLIEESFE